MHPDKKVKMYTAARERLLRDKHKGYKTVGAVAGGALGAGIGGTTGLVKTLNRHRAGEMDELDSVDKAKEYLKAMSSHAGIGLGAGSLLGAGTGEIGRRWSANGPMAKVKNNLKVIAKYAPENISRAGKYMLRGIKNEPGVNLADKVKARIMEML